MASFVPPGFSLGAPGGVGGPGGRRGDCTPYEELRWSLKKFDDDDVTMMLFSRLGGAEAVAPLPSGRH